MANLENPDKDTKERRRKGVTRRHVIGAGLATLAVSLIGDTIQDMSGFESIDRKEGTMLLPQRKYFLQAFGKMLDSQDTAPAEVLKRKEILNDVIDAYLEENLSNVRMFTSAENGASFPYAKLDTADFAKRLYEKYTGVKSEIQTSGNTASNAASKEFVFAPILNPNSGTTFSVWEEHVRALVKKLPAAIAALKKGEEPEHHEVYAMGYPGSAVGILSPEFVAQVDRDGVYETHGKLFSDFVESQLPQDAEARQKTNLYFYGLSIGGSMAAKTGEGLLKKGLVTQAPRFDAKKVLEDEGATPESRSAMEAALHLPHLTIRADVPPGLNLSKVRQVEIPVGFALNFINNLLNNPYANAWVFRESDISKSFVTNLKSRIGVDEKMSDPEKKQKNEMVAKVVNGLISGTSIPEDLKITKVIGSYDPLTFSFTKSMEDLVANIKGGIFPDTKTLGQKIVPSDRENDRTFLATMRHEQNWLRPTNIRLMSAAVSALEKLKSGSNESTLL